MTVTVPALPGQITLESFTMFWLHHLACFAGDVTLAHAMPHVAGGVTGGAFQSPFARRLHGGNRSTKPSDSP